jgi:hypothetical protein
MSRWIAALGLAFSSVVSASSLSSSLGPSDVRRVVEIIGVPAAARLMRSAEAYESWPGLKIGFEVLAIGERDLNLLGNGTGTLPGLSPVPRLYLSKGLFYDLELTLSFFPTSDVNPVATLGVIVKYCFYQEQSDWLSIAGFIGITDVEAFRSTYHGTDIEVGVVISKDYVRMKPYVGLGILAARGEVDTSLLAAGTTDNDAWYSTLHGFIGTEIELPLTFGAQLDLFNLSLGASFFVGKKF